MIRKVGYVPVCREWPDSLRHPQAKEQLPTSQKVNQDGRLYQLTKYHWLLLHECLETFAHGFSERWDGCQKPGTQCIDFNSLLQVFF